MLLIKLLKQDNSFIIPLSDFLFNIDKCFIHSFHTKRTTFFLTPGCSFILFGRIFSEIILEKISKLSRTFPTLFGKILKNSSEKIGGGGTSNNFGENFFKFIPNLPYSNFSKNFLKVVVLVFDLVLLFSF